MWLYVCVGEREKATLLWALYCIYYVSVSSWKYERMEKVSVLAAVGNHPKMGMKKWAFLPFCTLFQSLFRFPHIFSTLSAQCFKVCMCVLLLVLSPNAKWRREVKETTEQNGEAKREKRNGEWKVRRMIWWQRFCSAGMLSFFHPVSFFKKGQKRSIESKRCFVIITGVIHLHKKEMKRLTLHNCINIMINACNPIVRYMDAFSSQYGYRNLSNDNLIPGAVK